MGASGGMMVMSSGMQATSALSGAYAQSQAEKTLGAYRKQVANQNASLADMQADDATMRGDVAAQRQRARTASAVGSIRAGMASQGVDVNSGSASDVQASTAGIGALDELTIKNNAWREAWGYRVQSFQATSQGRYAEQAANNQSNQTLLTGGMTALTYGMKGAGQFGSNRPYNSGMSGGMAGNSYDGMGENA